MKKPENRNEISRAQITRRQALTGVASVAALTALGGGTAFAAKPLKVAAVFATPIEEPWDHQIHVALLKAKDELKIDYKWSEHVESSDFERVLRQYARGGTQLIMGDAFAAEEVTRKVAKQFPKVAFVFGSGGGPADPNFSVFDNWIHEPAYLCGLIAGKLSKTGTVGTVAAMDIPEVARITNAFYQGAREANPNIKRKTTFIGSFFDPPKAKEAALAQIAAGVDVIFAERFGVIEAAKEKGILAISNMSDQHELAPDTVITGPIWDMWPTVQAAVKQVHGDAYTASDFGAFSFMAKGGSYLAPYHNWDAKLPEDVKKMVAEKQAAILAGSFRVNVDENTPPSD